MTLFESIVFEILNEDVSISKVNDAIDKTYEVLISYNSENDKASGKRIIQPVAYGLTKSGNPVIRAYQPFGDTQTSVPAWKLFLLSGIKYWRPLRNRRVYKAPNGFNPNDDKTMSVVYNISKFADNKIELNVSKPKTSGPVKKTDTLPKHISVKDNESVKKLEKLKKQLDNPKYISDIIKNNNTVKDKRDSGPVEKTDMLNKHISVKDNESVKKLEKLKKQLDNPKYISDIIKNNELNTDLKQNKNTNSKMTADSGPVETNAYTTKTEDDIKSRYNQLNKNEKISSDVLKQWEKENEIRRNKYANKSK